VSEYTARSVVERSLGLTVLYAALWISGEVIAWPLAELILSSGLSPGSLSGGEELDHVLSNAGHSALQKVQREGFPALVAMAVILRGALLELALPGSNPPRWRELIHIPVGWLIGRLSLGLIGLFGWFGARLLDSLVRFEPSRAVAFLGLGAALLGVSLARAWDGWLAVSLRCAPGAPEGEPLLGRIANSLGTFPRQIPNLYRGSLGVLAGRVAIFGLFCALVPQLLDRAVELTVVTHISLLASLCIELYWYGLVYRLYARSAAAARAGDPSNSDL
jgi:hypothetical protein